MAWHIWKTCCNLRTISHTFQCIAGATKMKLLLQYNFIMCQISGAPAAAAAVYMWKIAEKPIKFSSDKPRWWWWRQRRHRPNAVAGYKKKCLLNWSTMIATHKTNVSYGINGICITYWYRKYVSHSFGSEHLFWNKNKNVVLVPM